MQKPLLLSRIKYKINEKNAIKAMSEYFKKFIKNKNRMNRKLLIKACLKTSAVTFSNRFKIIRGILITSLILFYYVNDPVHCALCTMHCVLCIVQVEWQTCIAFN